MKADRLIPAAAVLCGIILAAGVAHLFALRFRAGDIYPPYSSLRADPLGTKALFESLQACAGGRVTRHFDANRLPLASPDAAVLYLGDVIHRGEMIPARLAGRMNGFVRRGGRLVFTFMPRNHAPAPPEPEDTDQDADSQKDPDNPEGDPDPADGSQADGDENGSCPDGTCGGDGDDLDTELPAGNDADEFMLVSRWLDLEVRDEPVTDPAAAVAVRTTNAAPADLPEQLPCRTSLYFVQPENAPATNAAAAAPADWPWRTLYERNGRPVVVERRIGRGAIVLSAMSYFVSNEALRDHRHPALLVWLTGGRRHVIFDETHHKLAASPGLASLARRYRLHGLAALLLVLAGLFIWQNATSLIPRRFAAGSAAAPDLAEGKGSSAGLINLLRRNVPARDILQTCYDSWRRSLPNAARNRGSIPQRMEDELRQTQQQPPHRRDYVQTYNRMTEIQTERS